MKLIFILIALSVTGCTSITRSIDKALPEGRADKVTGTITGKFSSTHVEAEKFVKDSLHVTAEKLHVRHSDYWVPNIELEITGYERVR